MNTGGCKAEVEEADEVVAMGEYLGGTAASARAVPDRPEEEEDDDEEKEEEGEGKRGEQWTIQQEKIEESAPA